MQVTPCYGRGMVCEFSNVFLHFMTYFAENRMTVALLRKMKSDYTTSILNNTLAVQNCTLKKLRILQFIDE